MKTQTKMSAIQHTPGPWEADQEPRHGNITIQTQHDPVAIAAISHQDPQMDGGRDFDMERANARLIAAAPDLLAALKDCRDQLRHYLQAVPDGADDDAESAYQFADATIAKAEGRTS